MIRTTLILFVVLFGCSLADAQTGFFNSGSGSSNEPVIEWEETIHDFGQVKKGSPATVSFKFKNTSLKPVLVYNVEASCDCTAADYPKQPVKPGETAIIKATYDAEKSGAFFKSITVTTNTKEKQHILKMTGVVVD
jgi:hypothetical protein